MRSAAALVLGLPLLLCGCTIPYTPIKPAITSVTPSKTGTPNSVLVFGTFEFVSVQGAGQIFTYDLSSGTQVLAAPAYKTPCNDPSGMVIATIAGKNVMAAVCYDTGTLLTLAVNADGSLSQLGSVGGLSVPYPGIVLDGTNVLVPLFVTGPSQNGGIAKISIAAPAAPAIVQTVTLASPPTGGIANASYLALSDGFLYVTAGSESGPLDVSSTLQVVNEATMTLVGSPTVVAHSPQQIAINDGVAYVTFYDEAEFESFDIANPAALRPFQIAPLASASRNCHPVPVLVQGNQAYIGCFPEGFIYGLDLDSPSPLQLAITVANIPAPQRLQLSGQSLLVTDASPGGQIYLINLGML